MKERQPFRCVVIGIDDNRSSTSVPRSVDYPRAQNLLWWSTTL